MGFHNNHEWVILDRNIKANEDIECLPSYEYGKTKILAENMDKLHIVAKGLLEYETLTSDEIKDLLKGIPPTRDDFDNDTDLKQSVPTQSVPKTGNTVSPQPQ